MTEQRQAELIFIYGEPGTGKTEFAKYVAFKLGVPYAYLNFSYLIESYMGKTAQNLQKVFDFCKGQQFRRNAYICERISYTGRNYHISD